MLFSPKGGVETGKTAAGRIKTADVEFHSQPRLSRGRRALVERCLGKQLWIASQKLRMSLITAFLHGRSGDIPPGGRIDGAAVKIILQDEHRSLHRGCAQAHE